MNPTGRFGSRAGAYAAFRPSYPPEAVDAALAELGDTNELVVADVGAGTGISSRLLAERCAKVVAVEPNARMREAAKPHASVRWVDGRAENTGLEDQSVDVVTMCQAFHWFANEVAMREFRRIARRRAALLQYERDESDPFTKAYGDVVRAYANDDTEALREKGLAVFSTFPDARVVRHAVPLRQPMDRDGMLGRAASSSYLPATGKEGEALRRDLVAVFDRFARDGNVDMAMVTYVLTADW